MNIKSRKKRKHEKVKYDGRYNKWQEEIKVEVQEGHAAENEGEMEVEKELGIEELKDNQKGDKKDMEMKKLTLILIVGMLLISFVSATQTTLGTFEKGECVRLVQLCGDCTYNNITSIVYPNSSVAVSNVEMTQDGSEFNYTFCPTNKTGKYLINGVGDLSGTDTVWAYDFEITVNGKEPPSGIVIVVFSLLFLVVLGTLIGLLIYNLGHLAEKDFDVKDLIYNLSAYFILWGIYLLGKEYLGNTFTNDFLEWTIGITAFTNVILPIILFILSITIWKMLEMNS